MPVAIKRLNGRSSEEMRLREIENQMKIEHNNCLRIYGACKDASDTVYIVMEKADCSLTQYLRNNKLSAQQKYDIILGILEGMNAMHILNIIHRDLKVSRSTVSSFVARQYHDGREHSKDQRLWLVERRRKYRA